MKFGSLFSGIGGIDLGLERAGMQCAWQVEQDEFCQRILAKHWPDVPRFGDVRDVTSAEPVDLLAGGFPCQPFSVAGNQQGTDDDRHLWPEFARLVRTLRPRWVLAENVPGLRTIAADEVLSDLEAADYTAWPLVVGARHVGAPHRRDRVWIVAHAQGGGREKQREWGGSQITQPRPDRKRGIVAHANSHGVREQPVPIRGGCDSSELGGLGVGQADTNSGRCEQQRLGGVLNGKREIRRGDAHGRDGEGVGDAQPNQPEVPRPRDHRWPAGPGQPQHEWEEPRTVESPVGVSAPGLPRRLARHRRQSLKALGNACVPQVVEQIGRAIMELGV